MIAQSRRGCIQRTVDAGALAQNDILHQAPKDCTYRTSWTANINVVKDRNGIPNDTIRTSEP